MKEHRKEMCGVVGQDVNGWSIYCTLPNGHAGPHVATIGPYKPGIPVIGRWSSAKPAEAQTAQEDR